jgi:hypothetical protein
MGDKLIARPLPTHRTIQTQNKRIQTSMPRLGLEPTTAMFKWEKTTHALDRATIVIGSNTFVNMKAKEKLLLKHKYTDTSVDKYFMFPEYMHITSISIVMC